MKKIVLFLGLTITILNANCLCTGEINSIFKQIEDYIIVDYVDPTSTNIDNILVPQIEQNQKSIDEQNVVLEKLLKAEKLKALKAQNLVFLLEKLYQVESLE